MGIGISDEITPLGVFPVAEDINIKGGFSTVADNTERDAIPANKRKVGMLVYTTATAELWVLYPGLTNGSWLPAVVSALRTSTGPTDLVVGAVADGELLKRVGTTLVGTAINVGGVTGSRPGSPETYSYYFDTTLGKPIWYNGVDWVDATGAIV